jgi:hypothetical protein
MRVPHAIGFLARAAVAVDYLTEDAVLALFGADCSVGEDLDIGQVGDAVNAEF